MAKPLFLRFKKAVKGYPSDEDLKFSAVGRAIKHLDKLATIQSWALLSSFISEDPDVAIDLLDDEDEDEVEEIVKKLGKLRWFSPKDALATIDIMAPAIEELPHRLAINEQNAAKVVAELKAMQAALRAAEKANARFRFYAEFG